MAWIFSKAPGGRSSWFCMLLNSARRCSAKLVAVVSKYGGRGRGGGTGGGADMLSAGCGSARVDGSTAADGADGATALLRQTKRRAATRAVSTTSEIPSASTARRCFMDKTFHTPLRQILC